MSQRTNCRTGIEKPRFDTALFDFDGTLFDTVEGITKSIQFALRRHGVEEPLERLRCFAGPPLVEKFMEVYGVSQAEAEQLVMDFRERYIPVGVYESKPFPGVRQLLEDLRAAGLTVGVATSKPQAMAELLLDRAGMTDCFDVIVGSSPNLNNEKKWQIVRKALELCGADPGSSVLVGDTKYDAEGAGICRIPCVGVLWGYAEPGELENAGVLCVARDMDELKQILTEGRNETGTERPERISGCCPVQSDSDGTENRRIGQGGNRMNNFEKLLEQISINTHSSIRVHWEGKTVYVDPFRLREEPHDADVIFITHEHFDHFSPEDIAKLIKKDTVFVAPASMEAKAVPVIGDHRLIAVRPGDAGEAGGISFEAVPAYNSGKPFHPRENEWVGYVVTAGDLRIYIAGDTDAVPEAAAVRCDVAMLPIGGKYTMDPEQAAALARQIRPAAVIPTHYGSVAGSQDCYERFAALTRGILVCRRVPAAE